VIKNQTLTKLVTI